MTDEDDVIGENNLARWASRRSNLLNNRKTRIVHYLALCCFACFCDRRRPRRRKEDETRLKNLMKKSHTNNSCMCRVLV